MEVARGLRAQARVQVQRWLDGVGDPAGGEQLLVRSGPVNEPPVGGTGDGVGPLDHPTLLSGVDLLPLAHEREDEGPARDPAGDVGEELGLRAVSVGGDLGELLAVEVGHLGLVPGALGLVEHDDVLGRRAIGPLEAVLADVPVHVLHEGLGLQGVLEHLHERAVAREERRGGTPDPSCAEPIPFLERGVVGDLQAHEGLAGAGYAGEEDEPSRALRAREPRQLEDPGDGIVDPRAVRAPDVREAQVLEEPPGGGHERGQGSVLGAEEGLGVDGGTGTLARQRDEPRREAVGGHDPDGAHGALGRAAAAQDEDGHDAEPGARGVVPGDVARVGVDLVDVGAAELVGLLELEDDDGPVLQDQDVGSPTGLARQHVLEDGRVGARGRMERDHLRALLPQHGELLPPGADLVGGRVGEERHETGEDGLRLDRDERGEVAGPAMRRRAGHDMSEEGGGGSLVMHRSSTRIVR